MAQSAPHYLRVDEALIDSLGKGMHYFDARGVRVVWSIGNTGWSCCIILRCPQWNCNSNHNCDEMFVSIIVYDRTPFNLVIDDKITKRVDVVLKFKRSQKHEHHFVVSRKIERLLFEFDWNYSDLDIEKVQNFIACLDIKTVIYHSPGRSSITVGDTVKGATERYEKFKKTTKASALLMSLFSVMRERANIKGCDV